MSDTEPEPEAEIDSTFSHAMPDEVNNAFNIVQQDICDM